MTTAKPRPVERRQIARISVERQTMPLRRRLYFALEADAPLRFALPYKAESHSPQATAYGLTRVSAMRSLAVRLRRKRYL